METGIEIKEFYIGHLQTEFRAYRGKDLIDRDTNKVALIRRLAKRFGETLGNAMTNQQKSGGF